MIFLTCLFAMLSILGWSLAFVEQREAKRLRIAYKEALDAWQESIVLLRQMDKTNHELKDMLTEQQDGGNADWWKEL